MKTIFIFLLIASGALYGEAFQKGAGSQYLMTSNGVSSKLSIYVSDYSHDVLGIEYYFHIESFFNERQMWQQYVFKINKVGPLTVEAGYIKTPELDKAEKLDEEHMNVSSGVRLEEFLFSKKSDFIKFQVGFENIETKAGSIETTHYQKINNGQTVDFWISEDVEPIGLVRLRSKNPKVKEQNYEIELVSLLTGVKRKIDPAKAVKLSEKGKSVIAEPLKKHFKQ